MAFVLLRATQRVCNTSDIVIFVASEETSLIIVVIFGNTPHISAEQLLVKPIFVTGMNKDKRHNLRHMTQIVIQSDS